MTDNLTLIIAISVGLSIVCALIGLRTTWLAGSFFSRSRVNVATPPATPAPAAPQTHAQQRPRSPEERLADLKGLRDRGVIDEAEYERTRAAVLQQMTSA
jgi:hypothetical protein